jgi:hypothetical protein
VAINNALNISAGPGLVHHDGGGVFTANNYATTAEVIAATSTSTVINPANLNAILSKELFTGIDAWTGAGVYYSVAGTTFTVARGGTGFIKSKGVTWAGGQSIALTAGACNYVYMDSTGTIGKATARSDALFENYVNLFEVLVDSIPVTPTVITVREDHPVGFEAPISSWLHDNVGPIIENLSAGANITLQGTKAIQIVGADVLSDHGLEVTIPDSAGAAVSIKYMYTDAAGKWRLYLDQTTAPSVYNNAGTVTALSANRFGVFRIYVSKNDLNSSTPIYFAVIHTARFNTLGSARTGINNGVAASTNELYSLEMAQLGYVIYSQASGTIVEIQVSKTVLRGTTTGAGATNLAALVSVSTAAFTRILDAGDTNVQQALLDIDAKWGWIADYTQPGAYPYTALETDHLISVDTSAARTINLPNAPSQVGVLWIVKDRVGSAATNNITVTTPGGVVTIDGATTFKLNVAYASATFVWNGTTYEVI